MEVEEPLLELRVVFEFRNFGLILELGGLRSLLDLVGVLAGGGSLRFLLDGVSD